MKSLGLAELNPGGAKSLERMSGQLKYPKAIETCHPGASRTIFDGPGQRIDVDPARIRLLSDRVLLRDIPQDDSQRGSIVIPEVAQDGSVGKRGLYRIGLVIAVGPGDSVYEWVEPMSERCSKMEALDAVRRKLITKRCECCWGSGEQDETDWTGANHERPCSECGGSGRIPVTVPPQCKPGQMVLYDMRRQEQLYLNGVLHQLCHAEQAVLAIIEE